MNPDKITALLNEAVGVATPAAQLVVLHRGATALELALGWLDPEQRTRPTQPDTLFDMASVSKLFTVTALMTLVEAGAVALDQPVATVLPEFSGLRPIQPYEDPLAPGNWVSVAGAALPMVDAGAVTFRHLLTHTSGLPAWRPLWHQADAAAAQRMALETFFSYPTGARVVYTDIGLILLGMALERLTGQRLDGVVRERVTAPLELAHTGYLPLDADSPPSSFLLLPFNVAPTEFCAWRGRRIVGQVHDENAYHQGGVAGHAGIFSTARDIAAFGQLFLAGGRPLLRAETVAEMTRCYTEGLGSRRGLGFALWLDDSEASSHPFSRSAFGHTGFTGTSLWIDPERALVVALLTNEVYHGREGRGIGPLRVAVHQAIVAAMDNPRY